MGRYTGKVVLVERVNPTKENSRYYDGEYLIYQETENQIWGVDLTSGYGGLNVAGLGVHRRGALPLNGEARYRIVSVSDPAPWMVSDLHKTIAELQAEVDRGPHYAGKRQYVYGVYPRALEAAKKVLAAIEESQKGAAPTAKDWSDGPTTRVADGVTHMVGPSTVTLKVPAGFVLEPVFRKV